VVLWFGGAVYYTALSLLSGCLTDSFWEISRLQDWTSHRVFFFSDAGKRTFLHVSPGSLRSAKCSLMPVSIEGSGRLAKAACIDLCDVAIHHWFALHSPPRSLLPQPHVQNPTFLHLPIHSQSHINGPKQKLLPWLQNLGRDPELLATHQTHGPIETSTKQPLFLSFSLAMQNLSSTPWSVSVWILPHRAVPRCETETETWFRFLPITRFETERGRGKRRSIGFADHFISFLFTRAEMHNIFSLRYTATIV
jgi:hypothetical protein